MESGFVKERKYKDHINSFQSSLDFCEKSKNKRLTLRKQNKKIIESLSIRNKSNLMNEHKYQIHLNLLKTNNDSIRNFFIDLNRQEYTMNNLKYLLDSKNDDEVKFGLYATRIFFQNLVREIYYDNPSINHNHIHIHKNINHNNSKNHIQLNGIQNNVFEENKIPLYKIDKNKIAKSNSNYNKILELFLENDIIHLLFEIIKKCQLKNEKSDQINIFECLWILININAMPHEKEDSKLNFYSIFVQKDNLLSLISLIDSKKIPQEIIINDLSLLSNICLDNDAIKNILINSSLTSYLFTYLTTEPNLNSDVTIKVFRLLYELYLNCEEEMDIEAYIILFKIFSISLFSFRNEEMIRYSLEILEMLSSKDVPGLIQYFNDANLLSALNDIIFSQPIEENELKINYILDIFYNLISKSNEKIQRDIMETKILTKFYNQLLIQYKNEEITMNFKVEENILLSLNNIIYFCHDSNVKYIFEEGLEILNFFIKSAESIFKKTRFLGIKSFINILIDLKIDINNETIKEIANAIIQSLINNYDNCYYICSQCLYLLILQSTKQNYNNELRNCLLRCGTTDLVEKIKIKLLNDSKEKKLTEDEEENYYTFIEDINKFLIEG